MRNRPGTRAYVVVQAAVDVELLDLELTGIVGRGDRVLDLVLGVELGPVIQAVADTEHRARQVHRRFAAHLGRVHVIHLAVAPQAQVLRAARERVTQRRHARAGCRRGAGHRDRGSCRARQSHWRQPAARCWPGACATMGAGAGACAFSCASCWSTSFSCCAQRAVLVRQLLQRRLHLRELLLHRIQPRVLFRGREGR